VVNRLKREQVGAPSKPRSPFNPKPGACCLEWFHSYSGRGCPCSLVATRWPTKLIVPHAILPKQGFLLSHFFYMLYFPPGSILCMHANYRYPLTLFHQLPTNDQSFTYLAHISAILHRMQQWVIRLQKGHVVGALLNRLLIPPWAPLLSFADGWLNIKSNGQLECFNSDWRISSFSIESHSFCTGTLW